MSRRKIEPENEPNAKIKKPDHNFTAVSISACEWNQNEVDSSIQEEQIMGGDVVASLSNFNNISYADRQQKISSKQRHDDERTHTRLVFNPTHINELPPELLVEIFDYLSLRDLQAIRRTSKRWREIAGHCFQRSYSPKLVHVGSHWNNHFAAFAQFFRRISITHGKEDLLQHIVTNSTFHHLRIIRLMFVDLTGLIIDSGNGFFRNIEHMDIFHCRMDKYSANGLLASATNLKCLALCHETMIGREWFDRKYPTLEGFAFIRRRSDKPMRNVPIAFLVNNPNIREFGVNFDVLLLQAQSIRTASVKLDILHVHITYGTEEMESTVIRVLLNELYELKVFKRLHLYIDDAYKHITDNDLALLMGLKKLYMGEGDYLFLDEIEPFQLKFLQNLDELSVQVTLHINDIEAAATNLQNLERFYANFANFSHIVWFIKKSSKLKEIAVRSFDTFGYFEEMRRTPFPDYFELGKDSEKSPKFIDLSMLNSERAKLPNAQKVTLYVPEKLYLATKMALKANVNLEFIRLKRIESFQKYYGLYVGTVK